MNEIKIGALLNYIRLFVKLGIGFFLSPFILESLGRAEFGIYSIAGTIIGWLALCDFGLTASTTKFLCEYQAKGDGEGEAHFLGNVAALFSVIGCIVLVSGLCIYPFLGNIFPKFSEEELKLYRILYLMTLLNTSIMFPARTLGGIAAARQKYVIPGSVSLGVSLCSTCATIIILLLGYKSIALCAAGIFFGVLAMMWNVYYCFCILKARITWNGWDISLCKSVFAFSFWMFMDQLINIMNTGSSNFIVGMTQGSEEVSVYSYGLTVFQYYYMASGCIAGLFLPKVVGLVVAEASNTQLTDMMIKVGRAQLMLIGSMYFGILLFGQEFFHLWLGHVLGERTFDCWFITVTIMIPYGFLLLQALGWQILQARNAMKYRVKVLAITSFFSLILGFYLSMAFGSKALAIGTSCSVVVGQGVFMNWFYWKRLKLEIPRFFKETLHGWWLWGGVLILSGMELNQLFSNPSWGIFLIKIILFLLIYCISIIFLYAKKEERKSLVPFL